MEINRFLINALIFLSLVLTAQSENYECVFTVYIRTGSIPKGGTDSKIDLELWASKGDGIRISNVETWGGLMGQNYDYFERGNLDIFSGRGPCLTGPVCGVTVISDGSGAHHGWFVNYVEVTTTGAHKGCGQERFDVDQWLGLDVAPYELSATRNYCPKGVSMSSLKFDVLAKDEPSFVASS